MVATGRGFGMPPGVPKEAAATMEAALKRVYDSQAYKEYADRNMFEDAYLEQRRLRESARRAARGAARVSEGDRDREVRMGAAFVLESALLGWGFIGSLEVLAERDALALIGRVDAVRRRAGAGCAVRRS